MLALALERSLQQFADRSFHTKNFIDALRQNYRGHWRGLIRKFGNGGKGAGRYYTANSYVALWLSRIAKNPNSDLKKLGYRRNGPDDWGNRAIANWKMSSRKKGASAKIVISKVRLGRSKGPKPSFGTRNFKIAKAKYGYLYIMQFGNRSVWKIGRTKDISKRYHEINKHIPWRHVECWRAFKMARLNSAQASHKLEQRILDSLGANVTQHEIAYCAKTDVLRAWNVTVPKTAVLVRVQRR